MTTREFEIGNIVVDRETPGARWQVESLPKTDAQGLLGIKLVRSGRLSERTYYCRPGDVELSNDS